MSTTTREQVKSPNGISVPYRTLVTPKIEDEEREEELTNAEILDTKAGDEVARHTADLESRGITPAAYTNITPSVKGSNYSYNGESYRRPEFAGVSTPTVNDVRPPANLDGTFLRMQSNHSPGTSGDVSLYTSKNFDPTKPVTYVVVATGHHGSPEDFFKRQYRDNNVNAVYIVPRLGEYSDIKGGYNPQEASLLVAEASKAMMERQIAGKNYTPDQLALIQQNAQNGKILASIYSGGYQFGNSLLPIATDVKSFDAMYSATYTNNLIQFAQKPGTSVTVFWGDSTAGHTRDFQQATQGLSNVQVSTNGGSHGDLVQRKFAQALENNPGQPKQQPTLSLMG